MYIGRENSISFGSTSLGGRSLSGSSGNGSLVSRSKCSKSHESSEGGKSNDDSADNVNDVVVTAPDGLIVSVVVSVDRSSSDVLSIGVVSSVVVKIVSVARSEDGVVESRRSSIRSRVRSIDSTDGENSSVASAVVTRRSDVSEVVAVIIERNALSMES